MTDEVGGKLRGDHEINRLVVRLGEIDEPPQGDLREQLALGIRFERNRNFFRAIPLATQFGDKSAHVALGGAALDRPLTPGATECLFEGAWLKSGPDKLEAWIVRPGATNGVSYVEVTTRAER